MTYGIKALRKLQLGGEATAGTIVPATNIWRGQGAIEDTRETVFPEEDIGLVAPTDRSYQPSLGGKLSLVDTEATFEQLPYLGEMAIKAIGTGVADGAGTGKIYAYIPGTTSQNTIKTYTLEGGDNQEAEVMEYCFCEDFELSGEAGKAVMMKGSLMGRQVALQAFTGSIAVPTVEEILCSKGKVYSDAVGGTIGTTQIANEILKFSLKYKSNIKAVRTADGNLYFSFTKVLRPEVTLDLTFEHSTKAQAAKVLYRAGTPAQLRLQFDGSALVTPGTVYTYKALKLDMAGRYSSISALEDDDGDDIVNFSYRVAYNSTAALFFNMTVVNALSALT